MQIQFIVYFLINLVHIYLADGDNITFKNVTVCLPCSSKNYTELPDVPPCFIISHSNNLAQELEKAPPDSTCAGIMSQHIPVIYENALDNIHLEEGLQIENCGITDIHQGFMQNSSVRKLYLRYNKIRIIMRDMFKGVSDMEELVLSYNGMKTVESGAFENVSLERLDLSNNDLKDIPLGVFNKISELSLDHNKIKKIPKGSFNNSSLTVISLYSNSIEAIEPGAFENTPNLTRIGLCLNKLTKINHGIFNGFSGSLWRLETLDLSFNHIGYIETEAFRDSSIEYLRFDINNLTEIKNGTFSASRIKHLPLRANKIKTIEEDAFNIDGLEEIDLVNNKLTIIRKGVFSKPSITSVNLGGNNITVIEPDAFSSSLKRLKIENTNLDDNSKTYIESLHESYQTKLYYGPYF